MASSICGWKLFRFRYVYFRFFRNLSSSCDKDHRLPKSWLSASIYNVKKPTEKQFECTCMLFWW